MPNKIVILVQNHHPRKLIIQYQQDYKHKGLALIHLEITIFPQPN